MACMPNTEPPNDSRSVTEHIVKEAARHPYARVYPIGAVSRGQKGEQLAEIGDMVAFAPLLKVLEEGRGDLKGAAAEQLSLLTNYDYGPDAQKWREWNERRIKGLEEQRAEDEEENARRLNLRLKGTKVTE